MQSLIGKYAFLDEGKSFRFGKIIDADEVFILIKYEFIVPTDQPSTGMHIVAMDELWSRESEGVPCWMIFESRDEVIEYVDWCQSPKKDDNISADVIVMKPKGH